MSSETRLRELVGIPNHVSMGRLAEDYDGISQYALVSLARSSVAAAYKVRVAAGDFGGGRRIPMGTPVVVTSVRGQLEVLLGNQPFGCVDPFNRVDSAGWGRGPLGPWTASDETNMSVAASRGIVDHDSSYASIVREPETLPYELLYKFRVDTESNVAWVVDFIANEGDQILDSEFVQASIQNSLSFGTVVLLADTRDTDPGQQDVANDDSGIPDPPSNVELQCRVLIDEYGAYARWWEHGTQEPVNTSPLTAPRLGSGRNETWNAYDVALTGVRSPLNPFTHSFIQVTSPDSIFRIDRMQVVQPCHR